MLLHGQLMLEGLADPRHWIAPTPMEPEDILRTHDARYWTALEHGGLSAKPPSRPMLRHALK